MCALRQSQQNLSSHGHSGDAFGGRTAVDAVDVVGGQDVIDSNAAVNDHSQSVADSGTTARH